jgi:signal transduction histidine kinase
MTEAAQMARRTLTQNARLIVAMTAVGGLAITLLFTVAQELEPEWQNRSLHVFKETATALVLLFVGALLLGRFRRTGRLLDLLALAGVIVIAGKNLVFSVITAIVTETSHGPTTWRTTGAGMLAAALLASAALSPGRLVLDRRRALVLTAAGVLAALGMLMVVASVFDLPAAFTDPPETGADLRYFGQEKALLVADIGATVLFLTAGAAFARRAEKDDDEFQLWLGIGAIIAGMAYLNYSLFPSAFTDFIYAGDIFRIAAVVAWGIGAIRVIAEYQTAYARAAVLEERRRVARDLHDTVAQELAFISSQMHGFKGQGEEEVPTGQIKDAVQRALDESRGAIAALSRPIDEPLQVMLAQTAEEVAGRLGARVELDLDPRVALPPVWEDALPRILREAVTNAVRHGKAHVVKVTLRDADGIWLRITDDGDGFDPSRPAPETGFGLTSMKERTESLGGEFRLSSEPGQGTSVEIVLP